MSSSVLRLAVWCCGLAVLALVVLSIVPRSAAAAPGTQKLAAKHTVAQATQGIGIKSAGHATAPSDDCDSVDEDDDDDDCDDGDGDAPDPDVIGPTSRLPLPAPVECTETGFGVGAMGRAMPGARELPEDPP